MRDAVAAHEWLAEKMRDAASSWSVGAFGAIAEFSRDADEPARIDCDGAAYETVTARGGVRIRRPLLARPVAYETTGRDPDAWSHAVALCLPRDDCGTSRRIAVTEIGADVEALREEDRDARLFDLGLGLLQVDVCVRTAEAGLVTALRSGAGRSLFDPGNPAMAAILHASPHRVFVARVGRAEVYQPIPSPDMKSPDGPHTHLLPKLLRAGRTHAANTPIPEGWIPCAHLYPAHPAKDAFGRPLPFDLRRHESFQALLEAFGAPDLLALKRSVAAGVQRRREPATLAPAGGRFARAAIRVALRQWQAIDGPSPTLRAWRQYYDRLADETVEEDEQAQHG